MATVEQKLSPIENPQLATMFLKDIVADLKAVDADMHRIEKRILLLTLAIAGLTAGIIWPHSPILAYLIAGPIVIVSLVNSREGYPYRRRYKGNPLLVLQLD